MDDLQVWRKAMLGEVGIAGGKRLKKIHNCFLCLREGSTFALPIIKKWRIDG